MRTRTTAVMLAALVAGILVPGAARADAVAEFYRGRTVTILVGYGAGGGFGLYARLLADHIGNHIPGQPTVLPQFMPGSGSLKAANYLYNVSPKDGSVIGSFAETLSVFQLVEPRGFRLDAGKFNYIGRMNNMNTVVVVRKDAPATTLEEARKTEVVLSATGKTSPGYIYPVLMNSLVGTKFQVVSGYPGSAEAVLAIERGEAHGRSGDWASIKANWPQWIKDGFVVVMAQIGLKKSYDLPDVPLLKDLGRTEADREALEFMSVGAHVGRAFVAPPGVPADRVAALRRAFDETMKDATFIAEAKKRNAELDYLSGAELQALVERTVSAPAELVQRTRAAIGASN